MVVYNNHHLFRGSIYTGEVDIPSVHLISLSEFSTAVDLGAETDGNSQQIDIPDGLVFGDRVMTSAYVRVIS